MTQQLRPVLRPPQPSPSQPAPRRNQGWGKLVGAMVVGVAGALTLQLAGAITGMVLGAALGHWLDLMTGRDPNPMPTPKSAQDLAHEANLLLAAEVAEAFSAVDRSAGRKGGDKQALTDYLRRQLHLNSVPSQAVDIPWQQDLTSACSRLAERLDAGQKSALVVALYRHAHSLGIGPGPARLVLRDGVAALGISPSEEDELRAEAGML